MQDRPRIAPEALLPLVAGLVWLWSAPGHGPAGFLFSVVPGCLLLGSGTAMALWPGDRRVPQFAALGGFLGLPLAIPAFLVVGWLHGLTLLALSAAAAVAAGWHAVALEPRVDEVPEPQLSPRLAAEVAVDELLLSTMHLSRRPRPGADRSRILTEVEAALELFEERGWLEKPGSYHEAPPPLERPHIVPARIRSFHFERLSFESGYEPRPEEPGRERWLAYAQNRIAHAWVVRHPGPPRPWLVGIHGYQMGIPLVDLAAFPPPWLHRRLGMNLLLPVLPLHGPRKIGRRSGDGFLDGDLLDTVHAEAQAMWDIRRLLGWVRAQGEAPVGVLGYSLGGYNTALLASLEEGLRCAIPGVPAADVTRLLGRHATPAELQQIEASGLDLTRARRLLRVVSPLDLEPRVPWEGRAIFGAVGDRLVPPDQVRDLWRHWNRPRIVWYQGGHVTFRAHPAVVQLIGDVLRERGLAPADAPGGP